MAMNGELYSDFRIEQAGRQPLKDTTEKSKNRPFLQILLPCSSPLLQFAIFWWLRVSQVARSGSSWPKRPMDYNFY